MLSFTLQSKGVAVQCFTPIRTVRDSTECNCYLPLSLKRGALRGSSMLRQRSTPSAAPPRKRTGKCLRAKSFFNWEEEPLIKEAVKEPIAFFGGFFAGLLRLNLEEEPLKEWLARTSEAAGVSQDDDGSPPEKDGPVEISIE